MEFRVGVKALLRNPEGKVLLLKRSARYGVIEGSWDIPGGRIDIGTTLMDNLAREIREETGLAMTSVPKLVGAQDLMPNEYAPDNHTVRITYAGTTEGEPTLDGTEHTEHRWAAFSELAGIENLDRLLAELVRDGRLSERSWE